MNVRSMISHLRALALAAGALALASCGGGGVSVNPGTASTVLVSIAITPTAPSVYAGSTVQLTALGIYLDGSSRDLSSSVTWSSGSSATATVSSTGLATGVATGTTTITATQGSLSAQASLKVTAALLQSIAVTPLGANYPIGVTRQFTATGTYSDGSSHDVTASATWSSSSASATVNAQGQVLGVSAGSSTITAQVGAISGSAGVTINSSTLQSLVVGPPTISLAAGLTQQLSATGTYSDGSTQDLSLSVQWTSGATGTATVSASGLATAVAVGSTTLTGTIGSFSGSSSITVTPAVVESITVTPATPNLPVGTTHQMTATAVYSDGSTVDVSSTAVWATSASAVATVSPTGLATAIAPGTTTISATAGSLTGSTVVTVSPAALASIVISPAGASIAVLQKQAFTATGTYTDGSSRDVTSSVTWSSSSTSVATISSAGLASALGVGQTNISATSGTVSISVSLTVSAPAEVLVRSLVGGSGDGASPHGDLLQAQDGNYYGTAYASGSSGNGVVFQIAPNGSGGYTNTVIHNFIGGATDGAQPDFGALVQASDGNLYGTTLHGGGSSDGVVYRVTTAGAVTVLHSFTGASADGANPFGGLVQASDGNLYGTTGYGGGDNAGTVFQITTGGSLTVLHSFVGGITDGSNPNGGLIQATDGKLYGMTYGGGASSLGTLYSITTGGTLTLVHSFAGGATDGANPYGTLIQGSDGNLYGMTFAGGANGAGTIFRISLSGTYTVLHQFAGGISDGSGPLGRLVQASDGNFYGMTQNGGASSKGVVFQMTPSGTLTVLYSFVGGTTDGANPEGSLIQGSDGNLYGLTASGGSANSGAVIRIN